MADVETVPMTRAERLELAKVVRLRAKVAKNDVEQRRAQLLADVDAQLATTYKADDAAWKDITARAQQVVVEADAAVAQRCRELGIREDFRPSINLSWYNRGENASRERRAELRRVAETRLDERTRAAKSEIQRREAELLTQLTAGGLVSADAKAFLSSLPSIDELMPPLTLPELGAGAQPPKPQYALIDDHLVRLGDDA